MSTLPAERLSLVRGPFRSSRRLDDCGLEHLIVEQTDRYSPNVADQGQVDRLCAPVLAGTAGEVSQRSSHLESLGHDTKAQVNNKC